MRTHTGTWTGLSFLGTVLLLALFPITLVGQESGTIQGRVTDVQTARPLVTALVQATNSDGRVVASAITNLEGRYLISLQPGSYRLSVAALGYGSQPGATIQVAGGSAATVDFQIAPQAFELAPIVVSVGRVQEKAIGAPARVEIVSSADIRSRPAVTVVDYLRAVPGVDVITQGVQSTNVVVRGFNNIFSGALHTLVDNRIAGVPSLRVNVMNFLPTSTEDIERMEVVLGPGAALYGPNTANGVLHMITRSPLSGNPETSISLTGGEKGVLAGSFRTSMRSGTRFGIKVSGQILRAEEWEYVDPAEVAERLKFDSDPEYWRQDLMRAAGIDATEASRRIALIAQRDNSVERWNGEVRADWALDDVTTAVFTVGRSSSASQIELTGLGAAQVRDWAYTSYQARLTRNRLFAQAYLNQSNAGETFLLRNGVPIVDRSKLYVGQLQHQALLGDRQRFTYGIDLLITEPETEGTINGSYEDVDETTEVGIYLQSETQLSSRWNLVLAGRLDDHTALPSIIFSPRAALVFEPADNQAFRVTLNRSFSTPSSLNQFLDLGTSMPAHLAAASQLGYSVRVQGTGTNGFRFGGSGGYQMRSPFTPTVAGGPGLLVPAAAAANYYAAAVNVVWQQSQATSAPMPTSLRDYMLGFSPSPAEIGANFSANPISGPSFPIAALNLEDVAPIREETQTTIEVGYKGLLSQRLVLAGDLWYSRRENLVTPLTVRTPFVTLNTEDVTAYLTPRLQAAGVTGATAQAIMAGMARVPVGVISSADVNATGAQLLSTYTNVDDAVDLWGADFSAQYLVTNEWSLTGSVSLVNRDSFTTKQGEQVLLNASKAKGSAGVTYRNPRSGVDGEVRVRFSEGFPAESGVYVGTACLAGAPSGVDPCVASSTLVDVSLSHPIPGVTRTTVQISVQNLLGEDYRSFPGVPEVGRMGLLRLRYEF